MAKRKIQRPRGTLDILPPEQKYWNYVLGIFKNKTEEAGFGRICIPTFEDTSLFVRSVGKGTDIVEKEMYTFKDKSNNSLALRPEGTASIVRAYIENGMQSLSHPVRLYYVGPFFRYERPQAGRFREHHQFGGEIIGDQSSFIDVQVVSLGWRILKSIGLADLTIHINSIGCSACRPKYKKLLLFYYKEHIKKLCVDCKIRYKKNPLRLLDCKNIKCGQVISEAPQLINNLCKVCHEHFRSVLEGLDDLEIPYELDPFLVRGLDYYTKTVFEIWSKNQDGQSALLGGGRYDDLVELLGGRPTPAIGFGAGIERLIISLKESEMEITGISKILVFVAQLGEKAKKECIKLINELLNEGIGTVGCLDKRGIGEQLKMANNYKVPYTLLIGQKEAFDQTVIVKDMETGSQEIIPRGKIVKQVKKRLGMG